MRKNISCILILFVFLSLQYGKVATYLYCKWQAEILLDQTDCDCDDHLVALFDHTEKDENNTMAKNTLNEKITEFSHPFPFIDLSGDYDLLKTRFTEFSSPLLSNFLPAPFHPPAV